MSLDFDPEDHVYRWRGRVVPSVTQVLDKLANFASVPQALLAAAKDRGTHVHAACHFFDDGDLDMSTVAPEYRGYLLAWERFTAECKPSWTHIEMPMYHARYGYAGTPDRIGDLTHGDRRLTRATVDIKTSEQDSPLWGLQTAAYRALHDSSLLSPRFTVQLRSDGRYRLLEWPDPADFSTFLALLNVRQFCERHKL